MSSSRNAKEKEEWEALAEGFPVDLEWYRSTPRRFRFWFRYLRWLTTWYDNGWAMVEGTRTAINIRGFYLMMLILGPLAVLDLLVKAGVLHLH